MNDLINGLSGVILPEVKDEVIQVADHIINTDLQRLITDVNKAAVDLMTTPKKTRMTYFVKYAVGNMTELFNETAYAVGQLANQTVAAVEQAIHGQLCGPTLDLDALVDRVCVPVPYACWD